MSILPGGALRREPRVSRPETRESTPSGFRPDVQGLRAIAVLGVVLYHAGVPGISGGYAGVDVFFVISGFLITGHIARRIETGRFGFAEFYARRARRILPASFVVLIGTVVWSLAVLPPLDLGAVLKDAVYTAIYLPNLRFARENTDYLSTASPSLFQHYWSLGVEEQFYLLWPLMLVIGYLLVRRSRRRLIVGVIGVVVVSLLASVALTVVAQPWAFFSLPTRAWELGIGSLIAFAVAAGHRPSGTAAAAVLGWVGGIGLFAALILYGDGTSYPGAAALLPTASAALIIFAGGTESRRGIGRLLAVRPFQFIGLISYSLYLVHWPLLKVPQQAIGVLQPMPLWQTLLLGAASVPVAWLLHRFVEQPFRNPAFLTRRRPRASLLLALAGSLATCLLAASAYVVVGHERLSDTRVAPAASASLLPAGTAFVPADVTPTLAKATRDAAAIYAIPGCDTTRLQTAVTRCVQGDVHGGHSIALFGDSHAAQWYPALDDYAKQVGVRLLVFNKDACPAAEVPKIVDGAPFTQCDVWRRAVIRQLIAHPVDTIYVSGASDHFDPAYGVDPADWQKGYTATLSQLTPVSRVVVIADTPMFTDYPNVCLSGHLDLARACGRARVSAVSGSAQRAERAAVRATGATYADMTDYLCSASFCPVITGNTLMWRDDHHITATFSTVLADPLGAFAHLGAR